jgi:phosphomethylpyrimidine synthase
MKITDDVRKYAAEQSISGEQALQGGHETKVSREFSEAGGEIYSQT